MCRWRSTSASARIGWRRRARFSAGSIVIIVTSIVDTVADFRQATMNKTFPPDGRPTMRAAFLVSPTGFRVDCESALDNLYMNPEAVVDPERAVRQHRSLGDVILRCGVPVITVSGLDHLPDGVFPNNVFATVPGRFIIGAMRHAVRKGEAKRADVRALFTELLGYELYDLSEQGCCAELTGPLVLDRSRGIGYCGLSERADEAGCAAMHQAFGLRLTFQFSLVPEEYHTNVVLSVLAGRGVVLHPGSFVDASVADSIAEFYGARSLILDDTEKANFAGNCIAVTEQDVCLSTRAADALRPRSRQTIESWGFKLHGVEVDEFEKAGGSLRCLIAEAF